MHKMFMMGGSFLLAGYILNALPGMMIVSVGTSANLFDVGIGQQSFIPVVGPFLMMVYLLQNKKYVGPWLGVPMTAGVSQLLGFTMMAVSVGVGLHTRMERKRYLRRLHRPKAHSVVRLGAFR